MASTQRYLELKTQKAQHKNVEMGLSFQVCQIIYSQSTSKRKFKHIHSHFTNDILISKDLHFSIKKKINLYHERFSNQPQCVRRLQQSDTRCKAWEGEIKVPEMYIWRILFSLLEKKKKRERFLHHLIFEYEGCRDPTLHLAGGEVTESCSGLPRAISSQVESPGLWGGDFWARAVRSTLGSPTKMTHSWGVGVFWKEVSGEPAAPPALGDWGYEKSGSFYSLSKLLLLF